MINIVIPIVDKLEDYQKSIDAIAKKEYKIIIGITEELSDKFALPNGAVMRIFANGSKKEEIINSLKRHIGKGKVIIARRPFSAAEIERLATSDAEITYLKSPAKSKFAAWLKNLMGKLIKAMFGVKFFDGDVSLIAFDQSMQEVLSNVNSLSYSSRVDRWRGVTQQQVDADSPPVKLDYSVASRIKLGVAMALCFLLPIITTVLVAVLAKVSFFIGLLLFFLIALGASGGVIIFCSFYLNLLSGNRYFPDGKEIVK